MRNMDSINRFARIAAGSMSILTIVTFVVAYFTPPLSGPFCTSGCYDYPYSNVASRFPRDYYWMFLAILISVNFIVLLVTIHYASPEGKMPYSHLALIFGVMSSGILIVNYFVQLAVIQPALLKGETEGIAILTQYNPHGLFIVLEEAGYLFMSLSLFCLAPVFGGRGKAGSWIQWVVIVSFFSSIICAVIVTVTLGHERECVLEIALISINWLELVVTGILLVLFYRRPVMPLPVNRI